MPVLIMGFIGLVLYQFAVLDFQNTMEPDHPTLERAMEDVSRYQMFSFVASKVMPEITLTGSTVQTVTWADLRDHDEAPRHLRQYQMPDGFRVRGNETGWVICAPLSDESVQLLITRMPSSWEGTARAARIEQSGQEFFVLGEQDDAKRADHADWCL